MRAFKWAQGVLAAILLPALARAREGARRLSCLNNLSQIGLAMTLYAQENDGRLPWSGGAGNADCLVALCEQYVPDRNVFFCPSDPDSYDSSSSDPAAPLTAELGVTGGLRASYDYFGAYTNQPIVLPALPGPITHIPIMWDSSSGPFDGQIVGYGQAGTMPNHVPCGGNVLWLDGSVTFVRTQHWAAYNLPYAPDGIDYVDTDPTALIEERLQADPQAPWMKLKRIGR